MLDVARDTVTTLLIVSLPLMAVAMIVGLSIGLLQALTQIQEMTLVFVPKILAMFVTMLIALPFMGGKMQNFMERMMERIISG